MSEKKCEIRRNAGQKGLEAVKEESAGQNVSEIVKEASAGQSQKGFESVKEESAGQGKNAVETGKKRAGRDVFSPLRNVRVMANAGILSAIAIVLGFFKIPVTQLIEIRFAILPLSVASYLFGPVVGGAVGLVSDIGGYVLRPTGPFFPGFTITSVISGVIFGCMLYKRRPTLLRIFITQIVYTVICGLFLNSLWLSMLYGNAFIPVLTARIVKELVMIPVNTLMLAAVLQPVKKLQPGLMEG